MRTYLADAFDEPGASDGVSEGRVPYHGGSDDKHVVVARHALPSAGKGYSVNPLLRQN